MKKNKAIFLDRDGTIIYDRGYPKYPSQVKIIPGVIEALKTFLDKRYKLIIISNQSGIGRGFITHEDVSLINNKICSISSEHNITFDGIYYCPHEPEEGCSCRKPSPEMIFRAAKELNLFLWGSFMIGDKLSDIETGKRAGCKTILLYHGALKDLKVMPDFIAQSWQEIMEYIDKFDDRINEDFE